ncbi:MAG: VOC family protein [Chloroflexota bacterium]
MTAKPLLVLVVAISSTALRIQRNEDRKREEAPLLPRIISFEQSSLDDHGGFEQVASMDSETMNLQLLGQDGVEGVCMPIDPIPDHGQTVTPRLMVNDGDAAIDFYQRAFGAEETGGHFSSPDGTLIHAELRIGSSVVMLSGAPNEAGTTAGTSNFSAGLVTAVMATYWADVDAAWDRAVSAGAEVIFPLANQFYGERGGRLRDPFGQQWMMSQVIEHVPPEEMRLRETKFFDSSD